MLGQTTADDAEAEYIRNITENNIVTGDVKGDRGGGCNLPSHMHS